MVDPGSRSARHVDLSAGWRSKLAIGSSGILVFLILTGLAVWLMPFSRLIQVTVILHTLIASLATGAVTWYCVRHWLHYRRYPLTHIKLLGYLGVFLLLACAIVGLVLTWQALFGIKISYFWRAVHQWTMVAVTVFVVPHVLLIVLRDPKARLTETLAPVWAARKQYAWGTLHWVVLPSALVGLFYFAYTPPRLMTEFPPGYEMWKVHDPIYSRNRPFAPSMARTKDNQPIDASLLSGSESCGTSGCHTQIVHEWETSAHRYAAMDRAFQAVQLTMAKQNGPTSTRYCGGCHDPISLFSGTKNISMDETKLTGLRGYQEGISCLACHSVRKTDLRGNANYVVQAPPRYIGELEYDASHAHGWQVVRDFLIRSYPREHLATLSKVMYKKPQYCAACHKQFIDQEINKVGWVQLQNQYDNWRMSKWARHPNDPRRTIECRECHMPLVKSHNDPSAGDAYDYNRTPDDGMHRSHRFIAANQLMPALLKLKGGDEQVRLTNQWLKGEFPIPEIESKWQKPGVPAVAIHLDAPTTVHPGEPVHLQCLIISNKVGHDFPTGPLDIIQAWLEVVVKDQQGHIVYASGTVNKQGFIQPGSFMFKAEPVDQYGNLIDRHNLWEMVGVRHRRSLFPGFSDTADYSFVCPELSRSPHKLLPAEKAYTFTAPHGGQLFVTAKLCYRKIDQTLLNFLKSVGYFSDIKAGQLTSPVTDMDEQHTTIGVATAPAARLAKIAAGPTVMAKR